MESQMPFILQSGMSSIIRLQGLNPLRTISGVGTTKLPNPSGRGKLAREESLEASSWQSLPAQYLPPQAHVDVLHVHCYREHVMCCS
ncbi:hypothetical protein GOP47_0030952 [Adiantum capillus-veneris]|nr:hypothetical protein GOP47_0030952 [Adiantum capillus-veneris]